MIPEDMSPAARTATVLAPDEMTGIKWWLADWFLEWKVLASIKNDTHFLTKTQRRTDV